MHTIAVTGFKGGIGKTTTAAALGYELARMGQRVALVDLDPQAGLTLAVGLDAATDPWTARAVEIDAPGIRRGYLRLQPAGRRLATARRSEVDAHLAKCGNGQDVTIVDCPPSIGALTTSALQHAHSALVPLAPAAPDLQGLADVASLLDAMPSAPALLAVLTRVHRQRVLTREVRSLLSMRYPGVLLRSEIPSDARVPEAPSYGQPISCYAPRSRAANAYAELAREVAKRLELSSER